MVNPVEPDETPEPPLRLAIIGGGPAGCAAAVWAVRHGAHVTLCNAALPLGGTCTNTGCVPARTMMNAATVYHRANANPYAGLDTKARLVDFEALARQKRALVDDLRYEAYDSRIRDRPGLTLIEERARLLGPTTLAVGKRRIEADGVLIATGSTTRIPEIGGLERVAPLTLEALLDCDRLPESLLFVGASEMGLMIAQTFARFGSRVTVLEEADRLLPAHDADIGEVLAASLREEGIELVTGARVEEVRPAGRGVEAQVRCGRDARGFEAAHLVLAATRAPCTGELGLEELGVRLDEQGFIAVDETLQTSVPGIYAAGDVLGRDMTGHSAIYEARIAAHNALMRSKTAGPTTSIPFVVYTDPQIAGVGWDEDQARNVGFDVDTVVLPMTEVPCARAAHTTRGFIKLVRDRRSDHLVGARIVGALASEIIMEATLALRYGMTTRELASALHPVMTMADGIRRAAQAFER